MLQDYFENADWNMFKFSPRTHPSTFEEYILSVTGLIRKCVVDVVPTITIRTYPNQKPWMNRDIRTMLKA
jgi:hypothetical protein